MTACFSSSQSSCVGMEMPAASNRAFTFSVAGNHLAPVYLSKYSPDAYFEFSKPLKVTPFSTASRLDARMA
ncbi:hypothetical protein D9M72_588640 [compost metagenome]